MTNPFEDFNSDLAQATSKTYWAEESSCMEETFGTVQRVIRELEGRVKVLSDLLNSDDVDRAAAWFEGVDVRDELTSIRDWAPSVLMDEILPAR